MVNWMNVIRKKRKNVEISKYGGIKLRKKLKTDLYKIKWNRQYMLAYKNR